MAKRKAVASENLDAFRLIGGIAFDPVYELTQDIDVGRIRDYANAMAVPLDDIEDHGSEHGRRSRYAAILKVLLAEAESARKSGDNAEHERAMFAAGVVYNRMAVDADWWRGVDQRERLAETRSTAKQDRDTRRQDAVAELYRRWAKGAGLSRNSITQAMADEGKWGSLTTLQRYFRGLKRPA